jgi:hypothetical protein
VTPNPKSFVFVADVCFRERCAPIYRGLYPEEGASFEGDGARCRAHGPDNESRACVVESASPIVSAYIIDCKYHHQHDQLGNDKSPA